VSYFFFNDYYAPPVLGERKRRKTFPRRIYYACSAKRQQI